MKIVAGNIEIEVGGAFEDNIYEQDQKRPAFRMKTNRVLTTEELSALNGQTLILQDNNGGQIGTFNGYNKIHECTITMVKEVLPEE